MILQEDITEDYKDIVIDWLFLILWEENSIKNFCSMFQVWLQVPSNKLASKKEKKQSPGN